MSVTSEGPQTVLRSSPHLRRFAGLDDVERRGRRSSSLFRGQRDGQQPQQPWPRTVSTAVGGLLSCSPPGLLLGALADSDRMRRPVYALPDFSNSFDVSLQLIECLWRFSGAAAGAQRVVMLTGDPWLPHHDGHFMEIHLYISCRPPTF